MRLIRSFLVAASIAVLGCGGGSSDDDNGNPTGPPPGGGATNGTFTVSINGVVWSAQGTITVTTGTGNIAFAGSGFAGANAYTIAIGVSNPGLGTAPHNLNIYGGGDGTSVIIGGSQVGYGTAFQGGGGTLTVESFTPNRIVGKFSGTAVVSSGTAAPLTLAGGQFNITY